MANAQTTLESTESTEKEVADCFFSAVDAAIQNVVYGTNITE